jgi:putative transposase
MADLFRIVGISKQAFHQGLDRELKRRDEQQQLISVIRQVRQDHPRMGCRELYHMIKPEFMGRDRFEQFCYARGFRLPIRKRFYRTTDSLGVIRFPNLLMTMKEISRVDQVWVSDITYYQLHDQVYYITLITDLYSRRIVGWYLSDNLRTEHTTVNALEMAIRNRQLRTKSGLIFHSDGGGQYYSKEFKKLTAHYDIRNSMSVSVFENPHAERINGTIKNSYIIPFSPSNFAELGLALNKSIRLYNTEKPHQSLDRCSPVEFETMIRQGLLTKTWVIQKKQMLTSKDKYSMNLISN